MRPTKYPINLKLIIICFLLAGCSTNTIPNKIDKNFIGTWIVQNSSAEFNISFEQENLHLKGLDSKDGEKFKVSKLSWTTSMIKGTIFMPSTQTKVNIKLTVQNRNTIQCRFSGSSTLWKRMEIRD